MYLWCYIYILYQWCHIHLVRMYIAHRTCVWNFLFSNSNGAVVTLNLISIEHLNGIVVYVLIVWWLCLSGEWAHHNSLLYDVWMQLFILCAQVYDFWGKAFVCVFVSKWWKHTQPNKKWNGINCSILLLWSRLRYELTHTNNKRTISLKSNMPCALSLV